MKKARWSVQGVATIVHVAISNATIAIWTFAIRFETSVADVTGLPDWVSAVMFEFSYFPVPLLLTGGMMPSVSITGPTGVYWLASSVVGFSVFNSFVFGWLCHWSYRLFNRFFASVTGRTLGANKPTMDKPDPASS
jgi:hypothetical protein